MNFTQEFKGKALSNCSQFEIKKGDYKYYFVKRTVGKAVFVYGEYFYKYREYSLSAKLELYAIVSDGNVYVVKTYDFYNVKMEVECPENVFTFHQKMTEVNDYIRDVLFVKYYANLPIRELTELEKSDVKVKVRMTVLYDGGIVDDLKLENVMKEESIVKLLCGELSIEGHANEYFEKYREGYITTKSYKHELQKLADEKYNVQEWEIELADALRALDAKTVTVDFNFEGQLGTEKVEKHTLLRELYNNSTFSHWDFANGKRGEELLKKLGTGRYHDERKELKCEHIESVRYGRNVIFSKQSFQKEQAIS